LVLKNLELYQNMWCFTRIWGFYLDGVWLWRISGGYLETVWLWRISGGYLQEMMVKQKRRREEMMS